MGCFLIMTDRDFAQLRGSMRAGVEVVWGGPNWVMVQVNGTVSATVRQLAAQIRHAFPDVEVAREPGKVVMAALYAESPALGAVFGHYVESAFGKAVYEGGKRGEEIGAYVLMQEFTQYNVDSMAKVRGPDVTMRPTEDEDGRKWIRAEVKMAIADDGRSFGERLGKGYGYRQCSDDWYRAQNIDPEQTEVIGVEINAEKETVTLYRRMDADARVWEPIAKDVPLSSYVLPEE